MNHPASRARQQRVRRRRLELRRRGTVHTAHWQRPARRSPRGCTLLALIVELQVRIDNDDELVRIVRRLVNSGTIILTGNFAGHRI